MLQSSLSGCWTICSARQRPCKSQEITQMILSLLKIKQVKVNIFCEGHKNLKNTSQLFLMIISSPVHLVQDLESLHCGVLRIHELQIQFLTTSKRRSAAGVSLNLIQSIRQIDFYRVLGSVSFNWNTICMNLKLNWHRLATKLWYRKFVKLYTEICKLL